MAAIDWAQVVDFSAVGLFGLLVGAGELIARYRDAPERALRTPPAFLYVSVNVAAALAALAVIRVFEWKLGGGSAGQVRLVQVFTAGFASMALFRSSLFNVRIGDADVPVGPSSFLKVVLEAADRGVDRERAKARVQEVMGAMAGVSFQRSYAGLPVLCFELMQNVSEQDQRAVAEEVNKLVAAPMDDSLKVAVLGLKLMNVVGASVLLKAVESLAPQIRAAARVELPPEFKLQVGERERLTARVLDAKGGPITATIAWESSDPGVASVDAHGQVRALAAGKTALSATVDGVTGETDLEVVAPIPLPTGVPLTGAPGTSAPPPAAPVANP
jgi:hypothetical protein